MITIINLMRFVKKNFFYFFLIYTQSAFADEQLFGYVQASETMPQGTAQVYQWITQRTGKFDGTYIGRDFRTEFEYGVTDRLQSSFYINTSGHQINNAHSNVYGELEHEAGLSADFPNKNTIFEFNGISNAFKYNVLSPFMPNKFGNIGLALYIEPSYSTIHKITGEKMQEYSVETKIIIQKNFLEDRMTFAFNFNTEFEKRKMHGENVWQDEFTPEITSGLTYLLRQNWYIGFETRYHSEYPGGSERDKFALLPNYGSREHWAIFAGPTVHYAGRRWWITATYLPHLLFVQLGDTVKLTSTRFNLTSGVAGLVYSVNRDWLTGFVEIGVLV